MVLRWAVLALFAAMGWMPVNADAASTEFQARGEALELRRQRFAASAEERPQVCLAPTTLAQKRACVEQLMGWGTAALEIARNDQAYPLFFRALEIARTEPTLASRAIDAWLAWSVAGIDATSSGSDTVLAAQQARLENSAFAFAYQNGDPLLRQMFNLHAGRHAVPRELEFARRGAIDLPALLERFPERAYLEVDAVAYAARASAAKGQTLEALGKLEAIDPWCAPRAYAHEACLAAAISGGMITFLAEDRVGAARWRDRIQQSLASDPRTDLLLIRAWTALGASETILRRIDIATRYFEDGIAFADLLGNGAPSEIQDAIATYAVVLAESGYFESALAMA